MSGAHEVIRPDEIRLADVDPASGAALNPLRCKVDGAIQTILNGLFPPVVALGADGRDTQPFASTIAFDDFTGGLGIFTYDPALAGQRFWWATLDTRRKRQVALLPKKTARGNPHAGVAPTSAARYGVAFGALDFVAWDTAIYAYDRASEDWTTADGAPLHTLAATPASAPVVWNNALYWFTGNQVSRYDGASWTTIANDAVAGVVYGGQMWTIDGAGAIEKTANADLSAPTTVGSIPFTDDTPTAMLIYRAGEGLNVPYIVGRRRLYLIDPTANVFYQTGPAMPPHPSPIKVTVFGSDTWAYIAQGMSVIQWNGDLANPIGFDLDDGVPGEIDGRIVEILGGPRDLFVLTSAAGTATGELNGDTVADDTAALELVDVLPGYSALFMRSGSGWHLLALSDQEAGEATAMWLSAYDDSYRLWFAWDHDVYTIELPFGFQNPVKDLAGSYEASGALYTPWIDLTYHEDRKIGLLAQLRAESVPAGGSITPWVAWDGADVWEPLAGAVATTDGRFEHLITLRPPEEGEDPPVGRPHDRVRFRIDLARGANETETPVLVFFGFHAIKSTRPILGWTVTLDLRKEYDGKTPDQQWTTLLALLATNQERLLHFSYTDAATGQPRVHAVKITGIGGAQTTGPRQTGLVRLSLSEVVRTAPIA